MTTIKTYGWLSDEQKEFINSTPKVVSLLYDLSLLPEEVSARVRGYVEEAVQAERGRLVKWVQEQARSHHKLAVEAYDAKDEKVGDTHNALASAYTRLQGELLKPSDSSKAQKAD